MDSFSQCYIEYHKRFNKEAANAEKKIWWTNLEINRCISHTWTEAFSRKMFTAIQAGKNVKERNQITDKLREIETLLCFDKGRQNIENAYTESKQYVFDSFHD